MILITADDLVNSLKSPHSVLSVESEVKQPVVLNAGNTNSEFVVFENITFHRPVTLSQPTISVGIQFVNCVFKAHLLIENYTATGHIPARVPFSSIRLYKCTLEGQFHIQNCNVERGVEILESKLHQKFSASVLTSQNGYLTIERSKVAQIDFHQLWLIGLRLQETNVRGFARFSRVNSSGGISFIETTFRKTFYVWAGEVSGITSNKSVYEEGVRFHAVKNTATLTLADDKFLKTIQVDCIDQTNHIEGLSKEVYVSGCSFEGAFTFNGDGKNIEKITVVCSTSLSGNLTFGNCIVRSATIRNDNPKASIFFNSIQFELLHFERFNNYGNLVFDSCAGVPDKTCELNLERSNLGKAQFQNFDFTSFKIVKVSHSLISNIEFAGVTWFNTKAIDFGKSANSHVRIRDFYRQLKQASQKQGDSIQALEFQELEMEAHDQQLGETGNRWSNRGISLWLARTNEYGRNWLRAIALLCGSIMIFFVLIVLAASPVIRASPAKNSRDFVLTFNTLRAHASLAPQLLNPTRNLSQALPKEDFLGFWTYFWDAAQRIVFAFFAIQVVSAFRKYYRS